MSTVIVLPAIATADPIFLPWEREFHAHPCEVMQDGAYICGHASTVRCRATCGGCHDTRFPVYLCGHHLQAYKSKRMVYHLYPCGQNDFHAVLTEVESIEW